jgi:Tfp pilus assembly protein PilE
MRIPKFQQLIELLSVILWAQIVALIDIQGLQQQNKRARENDHEAVLVKLREMESNHNLMINELSTSIARKVRIEDAAHCLTYTQRDRKMTPWSPLPRYKSASITDKEMKLNSGSSQILSITSREKRA